MYLSFYMNLLGYNKMPYFLKKYLKSPTLLRLKKVGYFCGMDYASKDIYDFREYISRYDHSVTVALLTYRFTKSKRATISALFHDCATPCFSHVIDYMNKDYEKQESTEEYTERIILSDKYLKKCLKKDKIDINSIIDFKKYTVVDNNRPKVCADRIDGVILTAIGWTKNITLEEIYEVVNDLCLLTNEDKEPEISFKTAQVAKKVLEISESIDVYCHSDEDNYMMDLLANIAKEAINNKLFTYDDLYYLNEEEIYNILENTGNNTIKKLFEKFKTIKKKEVPKIKLPSIKKRALNPLIMGKRIK